MNVLSLFDGMSCGQIALERAGINVDNYYASEIDKYAIQVTMVNYPKTIQLGDVTKVHAKDLPKIDLLIGGSPCQGFSFAGKGLNFDDERSKLFFEYVRLKEECQPKYFLLENVQMKYEYELIISKYMKVNPVEINSALLSAQNRVRLYWTNINEKAYGLFGDTKPDIQQPKDKGIFLKDVLEFDVNKKYYLSEIALKGLQTIVDRGVATNSGWRDGIVSEEGKSTCIDANYYKGADGKRPLVSIKLGRSPEFERSNTSGKSYAIDTQGKDGIILDKSPCLHGFEHGTNGQFNNQLVNGGMIRRLTEIECERLQTVPDNYTNHVSSTQRYKMLGNGWTVDVIAHILKHIA